MSYEVSTETRFLEELERQLAWSEEKGYDRWVAETRSAIRELITELAERPTRYHRVYLDEATGTSYHRAIVKSYHAFYSLSESEKRVVVLDMVHERSGRRPTF